MIKKVGAVLAVIAVVRIIRFIDEIWSSPDYVQRAWERNYR